MIKRFIIGLNDNPNYFGILPLVRKAYSIFFPDYLFTIALVCDLKNKSLIYQISENCDYVSIYPAIKNIPTGNQAKIVRYYEATKYPKSICIMNDIDIIPLQSKYFLDRLRQRKPNQLMTVGKEWYDTGKFPTPFCTAEGKIFKQFINPKGLGWRSFIRSVCDMHIIDSKEAINQPFKNFSDESLVRALLANKKIKILHLKKYPFKDKPTCVISKSLPLLVKHLYMGNYIEGHHLFPINKYINKINVIADFLGFNFDPDWYK